MVDEVVVPQTKPFWKSKTLWFNAVAGVVTVFWPEVSKFLTPEQAGAIVIIGNAILRLVTVAPVGGK